MSSIPAPIRSLDDFLHLSIPPQHHKTCHTPPGHVLHIVVAGSYELSINNHHLHAHAGDYIIYHDVETVEWVHNDESVEFYSFCFQAPQLPIREHNQRLGRVPKLLLRKTPQYYENFHSDVRNSLSIFTFFCELLNDFYAQSKTLTNDDTASPMNLLWSQLETQLRRDHMFRPSLNQCCHIIAVSPATLSRICQQLHQQSPMQRLRFIRMLQAKSLLTLSPMNISQIANYLGYPRVHEFSREFKQQLGISPKAYRNNI